MKKYCSFCNSTNITHNIDFKEIYKGVFFPVHIGYVCKKCAEKIEVFLEDLSK